MRTQVFAFGPRPRAIPALAALVVTAVVIAVPTSAQAASGTSSAMIAEGTGMGTTPSTRVRTVQRALHQRGYDLGAPGVDGRFGPLTAAAVRRFQARQGLVVDGIVGAHTRSALRVRNAGNGQIVRSRPARSRVEANRSNPTTAQARRAAASTELPTPRHGNATHPATPARTAPSTQGQAEAHTPSDDRLGATAVASACAIVVTLLSVMWLYRSSRRRRRRSSEAGGSAVADAAGQPVSVVGTGRPPDQGFASVVGSIARPVRRLAAPVRSRRRRETATGGSERRAGRSRIPRRLHVPTRPVRSAHPPWPVAAVSTNLYLEAQPKDRSIGTVRGFAMAFACRQNGGGPERYFLVDDPSKRAPVWVSETEVRLEYRGDLDRYGMPPSWDGVTTPRASHAAEPGTAETVG